MLCVLVNTGVSGSFHSPPGVLFTFPSRYCSSIGHWVVFWLGGWSPCFPRDSSCPAVLRIQPAVFGFRLRDSHTLRFVFPYNSANLFSLSAVLYPDDISTFGFGLIRFRSPLLSESLFDYSSSPYLDVSVQAVSPSARYLFTCRLIMLPLLRFPHSDIRGSQLICSSPRLFAACHVLLRLPVPRHPPCALLSLTLCVRVFFGFFAL